MGDFGHDPTPPDIELLAAEITGVFAGMKTRSFIQDDGVERTVLVNELAEWVNEKLFSLRLPKVMGQRFLIVES